MKVERRIDLSVPEFIEKYLALNRPVIVTDAISRWPFRDAWSAENISKQFGGELTQIYGNLFELEDVTTLQTYFDQYWNKPDLNLVSVPYVDGMQNESQSNSPGLIGCLRRCLGFGKRLTSCPHRIICYRATNPVLRCLQSMMLFLRRVFLFPLEAHRPVFTRTHGAVMLFCVKCRAASTSRFVPRNR